ISLLNSLIGLNTSDTTEKLIQLLENKINTDQCYEIINFEEFHQSIIKDRIIIPLIDGFSELSQKFCGKLKYAIASGSPKDVILAHARQQNLDQCFSAYVSSEEVPKGKPQPDVFLEAARQLNVPINECFVIEDSPFGVLAGKASGAHTIAIPSILTKDFSFDSADKICASFEEASVYIESLIS
ncbi:MAG: HAD family hydrolase, partial [Brevinema sp.]